MKNLRLAGIIAGLLCSCLLIGCGDQYRPVVTPLPTQGGDPQNQSLVLVANNGVRADSTPCTASDNCAGSVSDIDTPGDVNIANHVVDEQPWSGLMIGAAAFVANRGSNTISTYSPFIGGSSVTTISLPTTVTAITGPNSSVSTTVAPVVGIATTQGDVLFAVMPGATSADPGVMAVINISSNVFSNAYQVGKDPIFVVELPDRSKIYVVNRGSGTLTSFAASDRTNLATIPVGSGPVMALPTPDSQFLFILNRADSSISVVKTATDSVIATGSIGSAPDPAADLPLQSPMFYDTNKSRLYVTNPKDSTVTVLDASQLSASTVTFNKLATVLLPSGSTPTSITVLRNNGSRAYVVNQGNGGSVPASVFMIDTTSFTASQVSGYTGTSPRTIVSNSDGSKVLVVNNAPTTVASTDPATPTARIIVQQPGSNVIRTSTNAFITDNAGNPITIVAPFQDVVNCTKDDAQPWNPSFKYPIGILVAPRTPNGHVYRATSVTGDGLSGSSDPSFCTTSGCTLTDNHVTWQEGGAPNAQSCPRQRPALALPQ